MNGSGKIRSFFAAITVAAATLAAMTAGTARAVPAAPRPSSPAKAPAGAPVFDIKDGVLRGARPGDAEEVVVPKGVKTVCIDGLVHGRMKVLTIPEGVETIDRRSGGYYPGARIETVRLPASVRTIKDTAFDGHWRHLSTIKIAAGSPYAMENGCLVDTRSSSLVFALPGQGRIVVPGSAKEIGPWSFNGNDVREIVVPEGVTKIGRGAFKDCRTLESLALPASVEEIGKEAFSSCGKLSRIDVSPDNPHFAVRDGFLVDVKTGTLLRAFDPLVRVTIPDDVRTIGERAFSFMDSLVSVTVPATVRRIEDGAFAYCKNLEELLLPERLDFYDSHFIMGCAKLREIRLPAGLASIGGNYSFGRCSALRELVLPEGVRTIGGGGLGAVCECENLERIFIPASVSRISGGTFNKNPKLATFDVHPANPAFRSEGGVLFSKDMTRLVRCPESKKGVYEIPKSVKRIDGHAFANCRLLTEIRIPAEVTDIGDDAFEACAAKTRRVTSASSATAAKPVFEIRNGAIHRMSLTEAEVIEVPQDVKTVGTRSLQRKAWYMRVLVLPEGVESMERGDDWKSSPRDPLEKVNIPASVQKIAPGTFYGFRNLSTIEVAPGSPFFLADGNLIDKRDGNLLHVLPSNTTVAVPKGVKRICDYAFAGNEAVREVVLPEGVVAIDRYAFFSCSSLESVRIPATVGEIGPGAFSRCGNLSLIEVSPDNPRYHVRDGMLLDKKTATVIRAFGQPFRVEIPADVEIIGDGAFSSLKSLTYAVVSDSVRRIEKGAFSHCVRLEELLLPKNVAFCDGGIVQGCASLRAIEFPAGTIKFTGQDLGHCDSLAELAPPEGVKTLRGWKTIDCANLTRLVLPASLKDTDGVAYGSIPKLDAFEVNPGNQSFRSEDGVLFSQDMTRLIRCPETKAGVYVVPETVKRIDGYAFANCSSLTDVRLPGCATNIGYGAFSDGPAKTNGVALAEAGQPSGSKVSSPAAGRFPGGKFPSGGLIAGFRFNDEDKADDFVKKERKFALQRVSSGRPLDLAQLVTNGALRLNGVYSGENANITNLEIPELRYDRFTVAMNFRPEAEKGRSSPLVSFGGGWRWFHVLLRGDGTPVVSFRGLEKGEISFPLPEKVRRGEWNWIAVAFDVAEHRLSVVLNGRRLPDIALPPEFAFRLSRDDRARSRNVQFANTNNGTVFKGEISGFLLFDRAFTNEELNAIAVASATPWTNLGGE